MRGYIEGVAEHEVRGWAYDDTNPAEHVRVVATRDGVTVGTAVANACRPDLAAAGIGKGDHGFFINFPEQIPPTALSRLQVLAEHGRESMVLRKLPGSNQSRVDDTSDATIPLSDPDAQPVFILGPARSGTSALALALLQGGEYEGHGEGHLLPLASHLMSLVDNYYAEREPRSGGRDTRLHSTHIAAFQRMVRRGFIQLTRATYPTGRWLDKTPTAEMVRTAPLLRELWPRARFIFCKRRVIEVIQSRRRKFPHDTLENHYLDWVDVLQAWTQVRGDLGEAAIEVDQLDMALNGPAVAARVVAFLDMTPPAAERFRRALAADHPEQTASPGQVESLASLNLSREDQQMLKDTSAPIMDAFGYSYDESYFLDGRPSDIRA